MYHQTKISLPPKMAGALIICLFVSVFLILQFTPLGKLYDGTFEPPFLLPVLNTLFIFCTGLIISITCYKNYLFCGTTPILFMGSGALVLGCGGLATGWLLYFSNVNIGVTTYNVSLFVSALMHLLSTLHSNSRLNPEENVPQRSVRLFFLYFLMIVIIVFTILSVHYHILPPFFIQGSGPTPTRQIVLALAFSFYLISGIYLLKYYLHRKVTFFYWYSLGLLLFTLATGILFFIPSLGCSMNWLSRIAQIVASIFFILAVWSAYRENNLKGASINNAIAEIFNESPTYWNDLLNAMTDIVVSFNENGKILQWNKSAERVFGYSHADAVGKQISFISPEKEQIALWTSSIDDTTIKELFENKDFFETRLTKKNGVEFFAEVSKSITSLSYGIVTTLVIRDITERKNLEQDLKLRANELAFLNKELETFSYSVAHDLRSPLQAIMLFNQILLRDYSSFLDKEGVLYLSRIGSSAEKMKDIISDMLNLAQVTRQEIRIQSIDFSSLIHSIANDIQSADSNRVVNITIKPGMYAHGDEDLLRIALQNLLSNAWKFTGKTESPYIECSSMQKENAMVFYISDNGAGFDNTKATCLFQPFRRLHSKADFSGTGVGLAIVDKVIRRHGGEIWAEGEVGKGATFYFTIPGNTDFTFRK